MICLILFLHCFFKAQGNPDGNYTAASPSCSDVSAAISAAHPGDIVTISPGTATWNAPLFITKSIKLIGAGIDKTVIISNYTCNLDTIDPKRGLISFVPATPASNPPFRLIGLMLNVLKLTDRGFA